MNTITFNAQTREKGVKNASKKALRNQKIIGVIYNHKENIPIVFDRHIFEKLVPKIRSNTLLKIKLDSDEKMAFIKEYSFFLNNHRIQHIDFQEIVPGKLVKIHIPLKYKGIPVGVTKGGFIQVFVQSIRVECDSQNIPELIEIDISNLDINQSIYLRNTPEIKGVRYLDSSDLSLVSVAISSRLKSEGGATESAPVAPAKEVTKEKEPAKTEEKIKAEKK